MFRSLSLFLLFLFFIGSLAAQKSSKAKYIDSLRVVLTHAKPDTSRVKTMNLLAENLQYTKPDSGIVVATDALHLAQKLNFHSGVAKAYNNIGINYFRKSEYDKVIAYGDSAMVIWKNLNDQEGIGYTLMNYGLAYWRLGNYNEALKNYFDALKIKEAVGNKSTVATLTGNIAIVYADLGENEKALEYYAKAVALCGQLGQRKEVARNQGNMGIVYFQMADAAQKKGDKRKSDSLYMKSKESYEASMETAKLLNDQALVSRQLGNIGIIYSVIGENELALDYYNRSLEIKKQIGDQAGIANTLGNIGGTYTNMGRYDDAERTLKECLSLSLEIKDPDNAIYAYSALSELYTKTKRWQDAFENFQKYTALKDSLFNDSKSKELGKLEAKADYDKQQAIAETAHKKEQEINAEKEKRQLYIIISSVSLLVIVLVFSLFLFNRFRITRRQKGIIEKQKVEVEEKNREITDSINYARKIQYALLAHRELLDTHLGDYFVLFRPKDIVSGDFYWAARRDDAFYLAVCDSTGHGVPGAFMSLLNISFLNEAVTEKNIQAPASVLGHVRERLIQNISQEHTASNMQDGMDGILCRWSMTDKLTSFTYAAAYNAPVVVREKQVIELPADKMPVGKSEKAQPFTAQEFSLQRNDMLYLFTDGFADQFGGPKGKKFRYKQLMEQLVAVSEKPLAEQQQTLETVFDQWKGELEQVDDICLVGIRF